MTVVPVFSEVLKVDSNGLDPSGLDLTLDKTRPD